MCLFTDITIKTSEETWKCIISHIKNQNSGDLIFECQKIGKFCVPQEMTNLLFISEWRSSSCLLKHEYLIWYLKEMGLVFPCS